jgi:hypothetical protein
MTTKVTIVPMRNVTFKRPRLRPDMPLSEEDLQVELVIEADIYSMLSY